MILFLAVMITLLVNSSLWICRRNLKCHYLVELTYFLGLQIIQYDDGIFISQTKYIKEMLKKFDMEGCKVVSTPMITGCKPSKDDTSPATDHKSYRSMIGNLLYVTTSRPYVMHTVGQVA